MSSSFSKIYKFGENQKLSRAPSQVNPFPSYGGDAGNPYVQRQSEGQSGTYYGRHPQNSQGK